MHNKAIFKFLVTFSLIAGLAVAAPTYAGGSALQIMARGPTGRSKQSDPTPASPEIIVGSPNPYYVSINFSLKVDTSAINKEHELILLNALWENSRDIDPNHPLAWDVTIARNVLNITRASGSILRRVCGREIFWQPKMHALRADQYDNFNKPFSNGGRSHLRAEQVVANVLAIQNGQPAPHVLPKED